MKLFVTTFITFNLLVLSGCQKDDSLTQELKAYLHSVFNTKPVNGTAYFFVTNNQCKNCVQLDGRYLSPSLQKKVYVISPLPQSRLRNFERYLNDAHDEMDGLKFLDYNSGVLIFEAGAVQYFRTLEVVPLAIDAPSACPRN